MLCTYKVEHLVCERDGALRPVELHRVAFRKCNGLLVVLQLDDGRDELIETRYPSEL